MPRRSPFVFLPPFLIVRFTMYITTKKGGDPALSHGSSQPFDALPPLCHRRQRQLRQQLVYICYVSHAPRRSSFRVLSVTWSCHDHRKQSHLGHHLAVLGPTGSPH
jgi:hypothetical protein